MKPTQTTASRAREAADVPPPPRGCAAKRKRRLAPSSSQSIGKAQALLFLLAVLPFSADAQPAAPTGLTATVGDGQVTLEWADPSDSTITGYSYSYATSLSAFTSASPPAWHVIPVTREPGPRDVTIGTTGALDTSGALEDSEGGVVASDDDGGNGNNFRIQRSLSEGTYYVRVGSSGSATGAYTLGLTAEGDDDGAGDDHGDVAGAYTERTSSTTTYTSRLTAEDDDHGDARSSATEVALPSETAGRIDPGSDVDYFRFEVVSETMVVTTTSHTVTGLANGTPLLLPPPRRQRRR